MPPCKLYNKGQRKSRIALPAEHMQSSRDFMSACGSLMTDVRERMQAREEVFFLREAPTRLTSSRDSALFILELTVVKQIFVKQMDECSQF